MGMGHVPSGAIPATGPDHEFPGRQHRRTGARDRALTGQRIARLGEALAARFLQQRGAVVVDRNRRSGRGEIDLLVRWPDGLVAVEVKTRVGTDPAEAFTARKSQAFRRAALGIHPRPHRLDLITVRLRRRTVDLRWLPGIG